jgi:hypothetical protein
MRIHLVGSGVKAGVAFALLLVGLSGAGLAQEVALLQPDAPMPAASFEPTPAFTTVPPVTVTRPTEAHRFWDRENSVLFAATAAFSAADFVVTRDNLRNGGEEFNPVTRVLSGSTAGLAANFAGETAGVVGLSYFFHRTGHHRLERAVSMVNIGGSGAAVSFGLLHR